MTNTNSDQESEAEVGMEPPEPTSIPFRTLPPYKWQTQQTSLTELVAQFWPQSQPDPHYAQGTPNMVEMQQHATDDGVIPVGESWHGILCTAHNEDGSHSYEVRCSRALCENIMRWSQWGDVLTFLYSRDWLPDPVAPELSDPTGDLWLCPTHIGTRGE